MRRRGLYCFLVVWITVQVSALDVVPGVEFLACEEVGSDTTLTWQNPTRYDSLQIWRDSSLVALLPGDAVTFTDLQSAGQDFEYSVQALVQGEVVLPRECELSPVALLHLFDMTGQIGQTVASQVTLDGNVEIQGWDFGVIHDIDLLLPTSYRISTLLETVNNGEPPDFVALHVVLRPIPGCHGPHPGVVFAVVINFLGLAVLPAGPDQPVLDLEYEILAPAPADTFLEFATHNALGWGSGGWVVVNGQSRRPSFDVAEVTIAERRFIRGDANDDGVVQLADAIHILTTLFSSDQPQCNLAFDVNHSESLDIADPIYLLNFLFVQGAPPADPYPSCGSDSRSDLGCDNYESCP